MEKKSKNNNSCDKRDTRRQESGIKIIREIRGDKKHEYNSCDTRDKWRQEARIIIRVIREIRGDKNQS